MPMPMPMPMPIRSGPKKKKNRIYENSTDPPTQKVYVDMISGIYSDSEGS